MGLFTICAAFISVYVTREKHAALERQWRLLNVIRLQGQKISWFELPCVIM